MSNKGIESDSVGFFAYWGSNLETRRETLRSQDPVRIRMYLIQGTCHGSSHHHLSCPSCKPKVEEYLNGEGKKFTDYYPE